MTYYVTRVWRDGLTRSHHLTTDDLPGYVAREDCAAIFPTTVIHAEACDNLFTCHHGTVTA